jgi:holo-[acyl-carrier protein] synthase
MQHVGIDIVEIPHFDKVIRRWDKYFLERVFTLTELKLYTNTRLLAECFAAKEAVLKVIGACDQGNSWHEIEILIARDVKPIVNLTGNVKMEADESAISCINVSIAHSEDYALAFVIGETI